MNYKPAYNVYRPAERGPYHKTTHPSGLLVTNLALLLLAKAQSIENVHLKLTHTTGCRPLAFSFCTLQTQTVYGLEGTPC